MTHTGSLHDELAEAAGSGVGVCVCVCVWRGGGGHIRAQQVLVYTVSNIVLRFVLISCAFEERQFGMGKKCVQWERWLAHGAN